MREEKEGNGFLTTSYDAMKVCGVVGWRWVRYIFPPGITFVFWLFMFFIILSAMLFGGRKVNEWMDKKYTEVTEFDRKRWLETKLGNRME